MKELNIGSGIVLMMAMMMILSKRVMRSQWMVNVCLSMVTAMWLMVLLVLMTMRSTHIHDTQGCSQGGSWGARDPPPFASLF